MQLIHTHRHYTKKNETKSLLGPRKMNTQQSFTISDLQSSRTL